jgi:hypothetical protein
MAGTGDLKVPRRPPGSTSTGLPDRATGVALARVLAGFPPEVPAVRIARQPLVEGFAT